MKKIYYYVMAVLLLCMSCTSNKMNLVGEFKDTQPTDTLIIHAVVVGNNNAVYSDTVGLKDGKFAIALPDSNLRYVYVMQKPVIVDGKMSGAMMSREPIIFIPGNKLKLEGTLENYVVSGNELYTELHAKDMKVGELEQLAKTKTANLNDMSRKGVAMDSLRKIYAQEVLPIMDSIQKAKEEYIKNNPNNVLSVYFASQLPTEQLDTYLNILTESVKTGVMKPIVDQLIDKNEQYQKLQKAKLEIVPGKPAPDFTLPDASGKEFTLSSLKGKYVVLDFWGTWCGWCVKGIPDMKASYDKYKNKIEFVSIDCGDTEQAWKDGLKKYELPWINVFNGQNQELTSAYAIEGYPTKIVVDADGMIDKVVIGEDPEFYTYLADLYKKIKK